MPLVRAMQLGALPMDQRIFARTPVLSGCDLRPSIGNIRRGKVGRARGGDDHGFKVAQTLKGNWRGRRMKIRRPDARRRS